MGSKIDPGKFDCYAAALPDEEQFVLNARDPAAAETVRYWITLRQAMMGRGEKPTSDGEMLAEAGACATRMVAWRSDNKMVTIYDKFATDGDAPLFVGPRWHYEQPPVSGEDWLAAFRQHIEMQNGALARYEGENASLRVALAEDEQKLNTAESQDTLNRQTISRLQTENAELRGHIADLEGTVSSQGDSLIQVRAQLASANMERDRLEAKLPKHLTFIVTDLARKIACGLRQVSTTMDATLDAHRDHGDDYVGHHEDIKTWIDRINGYAAELEAAPPDPFTRHDQALPDPQPETISDLAESPPINDHRFGHLEKFGDYAYARGLTVSPAHLPRALHEMEHQFSWRLVAIFGQTDSQSIGFIFKRVLCPHSIVDHPTKEGVRACELCGLDASECGEFPRTGFVGWPVQVRFGGDTAFPGGHYPFVRPSDQPFRTVDRAGEGDLGRGQEP